MVDLASGQGGAPNLAVAVAALILVGTIVAVLVRPLRLHEAWWAGLGAGLMAAFGLVGPADAATVLGETASVLLFLAGVLVAGAVAERAGVFALAALWTARRTGQSARRLFVGLYLVGAIVATLLSLDAAAVVLTPIVFTLVRQGRLPALPFAFLCAYVANTASLLLPVSNLTNLLVQARFRLPFWEFARVMALPALLAAGANLAFLYGRFRGQLSGGLDVEALEVQVRLLKRSPFLRWSLALLTLTLVGLGAAGAAGFPLWPVAMAGGAALASLALARREVRPVFFARSISWGLLPFVVGLFLVIRGAENGGLTRQLLAMTGARAALAGSADPRAGTHVPATPSMADLTSLALGTAVGSNFVNNIPMTLLGMSAAGNLGAYGPYALLLGVNLGPNLTVVGSLATMLALNIARQHGLDLRGWDYLKLGLAAMPISLAAGLAGLWLAIGLAGP